MKQMMKRLLAMGLAIAVMSSCFQGTAIGVYAESQKEPVVFTQNFQPDPALFPENEDLFAGYVESVLYEGIYEDVSTLGNLGSIKLKGKEKQYYEDIRGKILEVADGKRTSTSLVLDVRFTWTAEELGVSKLTYANYGDLISKKYNEEININRIWDYLLADCPYEMYWYDKTISSSGSFMPMIAADGKSVTVYDITMNLPVAYEYRDLTVPAEEQMYTFNHALGQSVLAAKENAQSIVDKYAALSRYEKMEAYSKEICELTSYNTPAGNGTITQYGNPWQLIWVFDNDESTEVVCEGYAKAFQYLCDLSGLTSYNVTGVLSWDYGASGSGAGAHMWNVVTFGGKNYLVDVTNMEHLGDFMFMASPDRGSLDGGYDFVYKSGDAEYVYTYKYFTEGDDDQIEVYGEEILTLATEDFDPSTIAETEVKFTKTVQNVPYTGSPVEITAPKVTVNGVERTDLEITYGYREFCAQVPFEDGLPTAVGLYDVQAYVGEEDLRKPGKSNIITVNVVLPEEPTPTETEVPTPTETEAPKPTETEVPTPTETEAPKPTETEAPKPTETEAPKPTETEVPKPTETEAPKPSVTEEPTVTPEASVTEVFSDVYKDWYTDYVQYVYTNNLMTGIKGTTRFEPNANITKAQVAQVLYNMEAQPSVTDKAVFTELKDVYASEWYANAVAWAYNTGVVTGDLNSKKFNPGADVTREQLALMMFRYAQYKGYDTAQTSDLAGLKNAENTASWAKDGVCWAVGTGLISGIEKGGVKDLAPQGNASRAQVAAILQRFCDKY